MKRSKPKIIVKPHYIGTEKDKEIIRRILQEQIESKLKGKNDCRDKIMQITTNS